MRPSWFLRRDAHEPLAMMQERAHRTVAETLRNPTVVEFVRTSVKAGYREFFGAYSDEVCGMVDHAFDRLSRSQSDGIDPGRAGKSDLGAVG